MYGVDAVFRQIDNFSFSEVHRVHVILASLVDLFFLAHLSRRLKVELIVLPIMSKIRRPSSASSVGVVVNIFKQVHVYL